ncbi:DNA-binding CsgD family transcriptional regulator [Actinoplanes tereljensis]|uniref:Helix-turn-helix transcriptional regulator n=1 Tax=Paractinoplanes tereljensis TaxID=571912 RepID=A0A919TU61_9ACTN|nr:LuxR C-terminal-related transcriptional regulator [Actinoplanes tereljensis]GIF23298.1 helix-turn-helix transcriptional regulator [Actinoplanes tereljensis]
MARLVLRGRSAEMTHALSALRRAVRTRHGAVLAVVGAAGIGKSVFAVAVADEARSLGFGTGFGQAGPETRAIPGGSLLVALRSGRQPLLDSEGFNDLAALYERPLWLIDRIGDLLARIAAGTPLLVIIDDVELADDLTRLALKLLPARLSGLPIVWMLTSRTLSTAVIDETTSAAESAAVARISLGPLAGTDIDDLARDRLGETPPGNVRTALGSAGGSPFWADQLVRGLGSAAQSQDHVGVMATTRRRLATLSTGAAELVRLAAVWKTPLPVPDATALLESPARGWVAEAAQEAAAGGMLVRAGDEVSFPHALVRDAVYAQIDADDRRSWHLRCGEMLLGRVGDEQAAATHLRLAEPGSDTVLAGRVLRTAGDRVAASPGGAAALARFAWQLVADPSDEHAPQLARTAAEILGATERHNDVVAIADAVLASDAGHPSGAAVAGLQWRLLALHALVASGRWDIAAQRIDILLDDVRITGAPRARLESLRAASAAGEGPRSALKAIAAQADRVLADPGAEAATRRLAATTRATAARRLSRFGDAWRAVADLPLAPTPASTAERIRALQDIDRLAEAAPLLEAVGAGATSAGDFRHLEPSVLLAAARQELDLGRLGGADALARVLAEQARETMVPAQRVGAAVVLAEVALHRGDPFDFIAADLPQSPVVEWSMGIRVLHATAALRADDVDGALRLILPAVSAYRAGYCSSQWSPSLSRPLLAVALRAGNRPLAEQIVETAAISARNNEQVASWVGVAKQSAGVLTRDIGELECAVDVLRTGPRPLLLAGALVDHSDLLVSAQRQGEAVKRLEEAADLYARAGAEFDVKLATSALARLGVRRRREIPAQNRAVTGWWSLTDSEQTVAELISAGHTNRSAATELGISPNTVNTHLRSVFGKLGVRSRVQLANVVRDRAPQT